MAERYCFADSRQRNGAAKSPERRRLIVGQDALPDLVHRRPPPRRREPLLKLQFPNGVSYKVQAKLHQHLPAEMPVTLEPKAQNTYSLDLVRYLKDVPTIAYVPRTGEGVWTLVPAYGSEEGYILPDDIGEPVGAVKNLQRVTANDEKPLVDNKETVDLRACSMSPTSDVLIYQKVTERLVQEQTYETPRKRKEKDPGQTLAQIAAANQLPLSEVLRDNPSLAGTDELPGQTKVVLRRRELSSDAGAVAPPSVEADGVPTSTTPTASTSPADEPPATSPAAGSKDTPEHHLTRLVGWFGYGKPAEQSPVATWRNLTPTDTNWYHAAMLASVEDWYWPAPDAAATPLQIAAWAWTRLSVLRAQHGLPITKPVDGALMGKRGKRSTPGVLGSLITERGVAETIKLVTAACQCVDEILATEPKYRPALDKAFFRHATTIRAAERFMQGGADSVVDQVEQWLGPYLD